MVNAPKYPGQAKIRVAVLYGGRSGEHEISLLSAASVLRNLDQERFEIIPVAIDKQGRWLLNDLSLIEQSTSSKSLPVFKDSPPVILPPYPAKGDTSLMIFGSAASRQDPTIDVVFPVMHGPMCEDGTIQGLLELADVAFVGCGVLASAVAMDKDVAKRIARDAGLPIVPFVAVKKEVWKRDPEASQQQVEKQLGYPVFVKPSNMGSSVGVHKVKSASEFQSAMKDAFQYDTKVLIEKAISAREIEVSILENSEAGGLPLVSIAGEINPNHEFYSYEAKYLDADGADLLIPAKITSDQLKEAQRIGREIFMALECEGMARVDMFLDKESGAFYLNEVNTIPGFTQISMYPKLWEASGVSYPDLLSRLIYLALDRHRRKRELKREFHSS